jgi:hypothetical protein
MSRAACLAVLLSLALVAGAQTSEVAAEALRMEMVFWESVRNSTDPADLRAYLEQYPNGKFAALARNRLAALEPKPAAPAATAPAPMPRTSANAAATPSGGRMPQQGDTWTYRLIESKRMDGPKERHYTVTVAATTNATILERYSLDGAASGEWTHDSGSYLVSLGASLFSPYLEVLRPAPSYGRFHVQIRDNACSGQYICSAEATAVGRETVKVPAGSFDAVKVTVEQSWRAAQQGGHPGQAALYTGARRLSIWYAPQVKRAVKYSSRLSFGEVPPIEANFDLELESYRLQ